MEYRIELAISSRIYLVGVVSRCARAYRSLSGIVGQCCGGNEILDMTHMGDQFGGIEPGDPFDR